MSRYAAEGRIVDAATFEAVAKLHADAAVELDQTAAWRGDVQPLTVLQVAELVQLALHDRRLANESVRATGERFLGHVRAYFAECPAVLEILRVDAARLDAEKADRC